MEPENLLSFLSATVSTAELAPINVSHSPDQLYGEETVEQANRGKPHFSVFIVHALVNLRFIASRTVVPRLKSGRR